MVDKLQPSYNFLIKRDKITVNARWLGVLSLLAFCRAVLIFNPPPIGERSIVMSVSVCLSACVCL